MPSLRLSRQEETQHRKLYSQNALVSAILIVGLVLELLVQK
jgi:hypothetical protein